MKNWENERKGRRVKGQEKWLPLRLHYSKAVKCLRVSGGLPELQSYSQVNPENINILTVGLFLFYFFHLFARIKGNKTLITAIGHREIIN